MLEEIVPKKIENTSELKHSGDLKLDQFDMRMPEGNTEKVPNYEKVYDPGERIGDNIKPERIENLDSLVNDYFNDIKSKSEFPETIPDKPFKASDLKPVSPENNWQLRQEFNNRKNGLRAEWEKMHGMDWPTYQHDVRDVNGNLIRLKGQYYDAHHIQPLSFGGKNEASNLTPMSAEVHYDRQGVHALDSPYSQIDTLLKG